MSAIIYYFSATGNSLAIAKKLQQQLPDCHLTPVASFLDQPVVQPKHEIIGLVFPLYYMGLPMIIENFLAKLQLPEKCYLFAVATRGQKLVGGVFHQLKKALLTKDQKLRAGFYITMPNNYTPLFNLPVKAKQTNLYQESLQRINYIAGQINQKTAVIETALFDYPLTHSGWVKQVRNSDRNFKVTNSCNGCGICSRSCPVNNIKLESHKPEWQHQCEECLTCLHVCPQKAIWRGGSAKRPQYRHPEVTLAEIMNQKINPEKEKLPL